MTTDFDAVVIGGGIAGCSAAITLAQQGINVALIEAKSYPHHKVCGEVLSPGCIPLLDQLGVLPQIRALQPPLIHRATISAPGGACWQTEFPGAALGLSRYAFDQALADRACSAGVHLIDRTTVTAVDGDLDHGFTLTARSDGAQQTLTARVVVGAHGKRSSLDRAFNRAFLRQHQPFMAFKAHFYGAPIPDRVDLHTFPGGYCGLSEIEGGRVNVCFLVRQLTFQQISGGDLDQFLAWMQNQDADLRAWFSTARRDDSFGAWLSISQIPFVAKSVIERDVLMTGDAAGLIMPLAGDGMEMALRGGRMAALASYHFLNGAWSADDLRRRYAESWRQTFAARLRLARLLQSIMLRPLPLRLGLSALAAAPSLGQYFVRRTRDDQWTIQLP